MQTQPLISIVTPVYNGADYLDALILSVLHQDYKNVEHIIIDDGSNDNGATVAILKKYPHLRWWSRENKGQYATLNEALLAAQGDIVSVICADDMYVTPSAFSAVVDCWQQHPDCGAVYGDTLRMNERSELLELDPTLPKPPYSAWFIRHWLLIPHCSLFIHNTVLRKHNVLFDLSLRYAGDWDWIIRLSQVTNFVYLNQSLSVYREHLNQTSQSTLKKTLALENLKVRQRYHANALIYWSLIYKHRFLKALWLIHSQGISSFFQFFKQWITSK